MTTSGAKIQQPTVDDGGGRRIRVARRGWAGFVRFNAPDCVAGNRDVSRPRLGMLAVLLICAAAFAYKHRGSRRNWNRVVAGTLCPFSSIGSIPCGDLRSEDTSRPQLADGGQWRSGGGGRLGRRYPSGSSRGGTGAPGACSLAVEAAWDAQCSS